MKFLAQLLGEENEWVEFGFENVGAVYASDDVMYLDFGFGPVPVVLSSVKLAVQF